MTTVLDIVTRAFRKIGVSGEGEALDGEAIAEGVDALNDMMHAWKLRGVNIAHVDLAASDAFTLPQEFNEGTVYLLASRLSPNYETPANFDANDWFKTFQAAYLKIDEATFPSGLTRLPSRYNRSTRIRTVS